MVLVFCYLQLSYMFHFNSFSRRAPRAGSSLRTNFFSFCSNKRKLRYSTLLQLCMYDKAFTLIAPLTICAESARLTHLKKAKQQASYAKIGATRFCIRVVTIVKLLLAAVIHYPLGILRQSGIVSAYLRPSRSNDASVLYSTID